MTRKAVQIHRLMKIEAEISARVSVVSVPVEGTWRSKYAVTLDGVIVLDTGSATQLDDLQAHSFASGLVRGLASADPAARVRALQCEAAAAAEAPAATGAPRCSYGHSHVGGPCSACTDS